MFAEEYEDKIKETLRGNPVINLWLTLGMKKKGYEMRLNGCQFTFDLFLHYKLSDKKLCNYFHAAKRIYT